MKIVKLDKFGIRRVVGKYNGDPLPFFCVGHSLRDMTGQIFSLGVLYTKSEPNPRKRMEYVMVLPSEEYTPPTVYEPPVQMNFLSLFD